MSDDRIRKVAEDAVQAFTRSLDPYLNPQAYREALRSFKVHLVEDVNEKIDRSIQSEVSR